MKRFRRAIVIAFVLLLSSMAFSIFITAEELSKMDGVIIISACSPREYNTLHIEGAINIFHSSLYKTGFIPNLLKDPEDIASDLGRAGITIDDKVVLYDVGHTVYAGKLFLILRYMGMESVYLLDGGFMGWHFGDRPTSTVNTSLLPVVFEPRVQDNIIIDIDYVKNRGDNTILVDVRSKEEFEGTTTRGLPRLGRIKGSVNFPHQALFDENQRYRDKSELEALFAEAGITRDREIILICESAVRVGTVFIALTELLGYENVRVYDGSLHEWIRMGNPLIRGSIEELLDEIDSGD